MIFCSGIVFPNASDKAIMRLSQIVTLLIGVAAVVIAANFKQVLDAILYAYAFMVAGLFVPTLGAYFWKKSSSIGALAAMLIGGTLTLALLLEWLPLPQVLADIGLDASAYGIAISAVVFVAGSLLFPDKNRLTQKEDNDV